MRKGFYGFGPGFGFWRGMRGWGRPPFDGGYGYGGGRPDWEQPYPDQPPFEGEPPPDEPPHFYGGHPQGGWGQAPFWGGQPQGWGPRHEHGHGHGRGRRGGGRGWQGGMGWGYDPDLELAFLEQKKAIMEARLKWLTDRIEQVRARRQESKPGQNQPKPESGKVDEVTEL